MLDARNRGRRGPEPVTASPDTTPTISTDDQAAALTLRPAVKPAPRPVSSGIAVVPAPRALSVVLEPLAPRTDPVVRLLSADVRHDPFPFLDDLRRRGRVVRGRTALVTAHHDVCSAVLADPSTFSSARSLHLAMGGLWPDRGEDSEPSLRPAEFAHHDVDALNGVDVPYAGALISTDPPEHTRLRHLVSRAFATDAVEQLRPDVEGLVDGLIDELTHKPSVDLVPDFAQSLALMIIAEILGVPSAQWPQLRAWAEDLFSAGEATTAPARRAALRSQHALRRYLEDLLAVRGHEPGDALVDGLLLPDEAGDSLSLREAGATALLVLQAGYETVATVIGNGIHALGRHPGQVEVLLARPELWPNTVEEVMRWNPAIVLTTRIARTDTHLAGTVAPAGSQIILALAGANRDPEVFDAPDIFDVERENAARHLGMGGGVHACIGGVLGRLETDIALRRLFERFPNLRFASPPVRTSGLALRGFASLRVRLGRPAHHD